MATVAEAPPSASSVFSLYILVTHLHVNDVIVAGVHRFESERYCRFLSDISISMKDTVLKHGFLHQTRSTSYVLILYFVGEDHHIPFCDTDVPVSLANRDDNSFDTDVSRTIRIRLWIHCHRHVLRPANSFFSCAHRL